MKVHPILFAIFETTRPVFIQTLEHCLRYFVSWEITLLYCFSWNYISFGPKEPIKVQNFRLLSAHVKIRQLCNLISFFCWKYIKFQIEKYKGVVSHDTEEWCKIWRKTDLSFQKWQEFAEFWPEHSKVSKIWIFIGSFSGKHITFDLKKYSGVILHCTEKWCKIWRKNDLWFRKWHKKFGKFDQSTWKCRNWDFDRIFLSEVENAWAKNLRRSYV